MWGIPSWAIGIAVIMLAISLGKSLTVMLGGGTPAKRGRGDGASDAELARQAEALEDAQRRLSELEERMDFAERLLAKQRDGERLAPPRS